LPPAQQQKLLDFLGFLKKWSGHYNLTAITDTQKMITRHLLDSLAIAPYITGNNILDIGSGAGFPGIPLAVYFPQKHVTLLDSNGKKTRFLIQAKAEFQLSNITVINARMETWQASQPFDTIVVRAVGSIPEVMAESRHLLQPGGQWLFMKTDPQNEQLTALQPPAVIHLLNVPGIPESRCVIAVRAI
jgi:16S rRNA (guanine527-N7)-methyltransferase